MNPSLRFSVKRKLLPPVLIARKLRVQRPGLQELAWSQPRRFSQFGEDAYLMRHFAGQDTGFFVDVGAYHPFSQSNTYLLYRRGWRGINVEPDPDAFSEFVRHRSRDVNLQLAVSNRAGEAQFVRAGSFAGIDDGSHLWPGIEGSRITVPTRTLEHILDEHLPASTSIDLLDVDCEGHDLEILRSNDWSRYRPSIIMAEAHTPQMGSEILEFLESVGYGRRTQLDLTLIFAPR